MTLKYPVERFVLMDSTCTAEFSSVYGEGFDSKIVGWDNYLRENSGDMCSGRYRILKKPLKAGEMY